MKVIAWIVLALILVFGLWLAFFGGVDWLYNQADKHRSPAEFIPVEIAPTPDSTLSKPDSLNRTVNNQIKIFGDIKEKLAIRVIAEIHRMEKDSTIKEIEILIDSEGGWTQSTLWLCYAMKLSKKPIKTVVLGQALSGAAYILSSGTKYRRFAAKNVRIMIHRPFIFYTMTPMWSEDLEADARDLRSLEQIFFDLLSENTGRDIEQIKKETRRDLWFNYKGAIEYSLIDSLYQK